MRGQVPGVEGLQMVSQYWGVHIPPEYLEHFYTHPKRLQNVGKLRSRVSQSESILIVQDLYIPCTLLRS